MKKMLAILLAALLVLSLGACGNDGTAEGDPKTSDAYPEKAITVIVPFSAGGEHDLTARVVAGRLNEMFGWNVVIQNTSGDVAATIEYMNGDNGDGYTLFMHSPEVMSSNYASGLLPEAYYKDMIYLGNFVYDPLTICVAADSPYQTLQELLEAAKANPGTLNWASVGSGGLNQMNAENLWNIADVEFNYVPYDDASKGRAAVLGGHADVFHSFAGGAKSTVDSGQLRVLAVGSEERLDYWPDVPTLKELGYDVVTGLTRCWDTHPDTDPAIVEVLTAKFKECLDDPQTQQQLLDMGQAPTWMTDEEMHEYGEYYYGVYSDILARLNAEE